VVEVLAWGAALFAAGGLLVLERRCLGQMVVVQPLVVCLLAGWIAGDEAVGLWLGVSLQLFSVGQSRHFDWAMIGVVAGASLAACSVLGLALAPGSAAASSLALVALGAGFGSREIDRRFARADGARQRSRSPWNEPNPARAVEALVRGVVLRWFAVGGVQVVVSTALALVVALGTDRLLVGGGERAGLVAAAVTTGGVGVALASLSGYRIFALAGATAALSWAVLTLVVPA
jgi:hypothetical protein